MRRDHGANTGPAAHDVRAGPFTNSFEEHEMVTAKQGIDELGDGEGRWSFCRTHNGWYTRGYCPGCSPERARAELRKEIIGVIITVLLIGGWTAWSYFHG